MNDLKNMNITPKKVIKWTIFVVAFFFLYAYFQSTMPTGHSLGLSGTAVNVTAPSFAEVSGGGYVAQDLVMKNEAIRVSAPSSETGDAYGIVPLPTSPAAPAGVSKIVKTGDLSLLVRNVDDAAVAINQLRTTLGGQPGNENFMQYGGGRRGDITIWVPSEKFDDAMLAIKKLALRVDNESVNVQDVSAQYVDLGARLTTLKASEQSYLTLLKQTGKIPDILEVTRYLNETRTQIEQTQGQMDYLSRQVALSSIHVNLTQEAVPGEVVSNEWRPLTVVKEAFRSTLSDLTDSIDMFLVLLVRLPVLLLNLAFWALIIWGCYRAGRFVHRKIMTASVQKKDGV